MGLNPRLWVLILVKILLDEDSDSNSAALEL